jgi:site-specific DNA-methyltransferase (adenine-specific)
MIEHAAAPRGRRSPLPIRRNARNVMSGYALLRTLADGCAALAFLDPQYRGLLDKQKYGNRERMKARHELPQMDERTIALFVEQIERALRPGGHLMLWIDKFSLGSGTHLRYLAYAERLRVVDLIHWNKLRFGMGRRGRCCSEYLVVLQKEPTRAKGVWTDNRIPDTWPEASDRGRHPHAKPHQLVERLIRAVTRKGDLVVDPCAGGYGVLDACILSGREFAGCDLTEGGLPTCPEPLTPTPGKPARAASARSPASSSGSRRKPAAPPPASRPSRSRSKTRATAR